MRRKCLRLICGIVTAGIVSVGVWADAEYWVPVGSYQQRDTAESAARDARDVLGAPIAIIGASTASGFYFRVVAGPYASRSEAMDMAEAAKARGFGDAWVWSRQSDDEIGVDSYVDDLLDTPSDTDYDALFDDLDLDLDLELELDGQEEGLDEDIIPADRELPDLIEEAPDDYKLNKLRRDAQAVPQQATPPQARPPPPPTITLPSQQVVSLDVGNPISLVRYQESDLNMRIDGKLDERVWSEFPGVDAFRVVDPDTGQQPRHRTLVKMFYTERGLYASFEMEQPADTLVRWYSGRDQGRLNRDNVGVTIDTSGEGRYGYWVNLALGGNQIDGTVLPERQFSSDWDGAWYGGTQISKKGWNAEIFLPWSQLAMPKEPGERRINAYASRKVAYLNERYAVPALPFTQPLFMSALQPLQLNDVDPKQQWSMFPYVSVTRDEVEDFTQTKAGTDIFWRPSSNFQVTATLNPDFGNVESDEVIVNLSAFETFFPEKRLFFQEGTEVFSTSPRNRSWDGEPTTILNTRRIGGAPFAPEVPAGVTVPSRELNQPTELVGAVKVVGQFGRVRYGVLGAAEDEIKFDVGDANYHQDGSDYGVARMLYESKTDDGSYRAVGGIATLAAHEVQDASVLGVDYHYLSNGGAWKVDGQLLQSDIDGVGTGHGGFVDVGRSLRKGLNLRWGVSHFDDKLDLNALGFLRRNDATNTKLDLDYRRSDVDWASQISVNAFAEYEVNGDGDRTRTGVGGRFGADLHNRDQVRLFLAYSPDLDEDRNSRGNGTYEIEGAHGVELDYETDSSRRVSYRMKIGHGGEELGGDRYTGELGVVWRPIDQLNVGAIAQYQRRNGWLLWQEDRNFTTFDTIEWRPRLNIDYFLTAKQQLRLSAQWVGIKASEQEFFLVPDRVGELIEVDKPPGPTDDFAISRVNLQLRYRWEIAPLSELSVVYTLNGSQAARSGAFNDLFNDALEEPVGEQLIVKLRYRLGS